MQLQKLNQHTPDPESRLARVVECPRPGTTNATDQRRVDMRNFGFRLRSTLFILGTFSLVCFWGCTEQIEDTDVAGSNAELEQTLESIADSLDDRLDSDEEPGFGDDRFSREFGEEGDEEASRDDVRTDGGTDRPDADRPETDRPDVSDVRVYNIMVVWGRIAPNDDTRPEPTRWNPVMHVNEGNGVSVRRALRFERGDEVLAQEVRHQAPIQSVTGPHVDGVIVQVAVADPADAWFGVETSLTAMRFPLAELHDLEERHILDRSGNGLLITSIERPVVDDGCASGFVAGRWAQTRRGTYFGGQITNAEGRLIGHLAGEAAEGNLRGKLIDLDGRFRGAMLGHYEDGHFRAETFNRD